MADERIAADTAQAVPQAGPDVPFELRAINAEQVGMLLGLAPRTVLENVACLPNFPVRLTMRPATWVAGEVLKWRDANRAGLPKPRRRSATMGSRATHSVECDAAQAAAARFCSAPTREDG